MTKIDIVSGFLGAGKTTLIKKLLAESFPGEKLVLIENEFGEISIDGGFLKDSGVQISEMSSGCICCSLVGDFNRALKDVHDQFHPDRILIEPSGVGKLSDVIVAVENTVKDVPDMKLNSFVTVADATKVKVYMKNFGEFYNNQIETANTIILSRTDGMKEEKLDQCVAMIREHNKDAVIVTTPWPELTGEQLMEAMEQRSTIAVELAKLEEEAHHHHHDHDDDDDDEDEHEHHHHDHDEHDHDDHCCCGHHHDHDHDEDDDEHEHEHEHHHDHDEHDHEEHEEHEHHHDHEEDDHEDHCCHHHHDHDHEDDDDHDEHEHHHHDEDGHCCCGHHHHHHHDHDADEVFTSWGVETAKKFSKADIEHALTELDGGKYGMILRSKGIVDGGADGWLEFDYVPGEWEVRQRGADVGGKLVVIGSKLDEKAIAALFGC